MSHQRAWLIVDEDGVAASVGTASTANTSMTPPSKPASVVGQIIDDEDCVFIVGSPVRQDGCAVFMPTN